MNDKITQLLLERLAQLDKRDAERLAAICGTQHVLAVHIAKQSGRSEDEVTKEIHDWAARFKHHLLGSLQDQSPDIAALINRLASGEAFPKDQSKPPKDKPKESE